MRAILFLALLALPFSFADEPDKPQRPERITYAAGEKVFVIVEKFDLATGAKNWTPATVIEVKSGKYTVKTDASIHGQQTFYGLDGEQIKKK